MTTQIYDPKEILGDFLRTRVTDPRSRHTLTSDSFTATAAQTEFTVTPTSGYRMQAVSSVTVNTAAQNKWEDYYIDTQNQKIVLISGATVSDAVVVNYWEGTGSWIYPDKPREDIGPASFPRMSIMVVGSPGDRLGKYDAAVEHNIHFQVDIWARLAKGSPETQIFTVAGRKYEGDRLAHVLGNQVCQALKLYESDLHPIMYDYHPVSGPRSLPVEREHEVFHTVIEFQLKMLNIGEAL